MNSSTIAQFKQSVSGNFSGYRDQAYVLSQKFYDSVNVANDFIQQVMSILTDLYYESYEVDEESADTLYFDNEYKDTLYDSFIEFDDTGTLCLESTRGCLQIKEMGESEGYLGFNVYAGSNLLASFDIIASELSQDKVTLYHVVRRMSFNWNAVPCLLEVGTINFDLLDHLQDVAKGRGMMYGIASICETIGDATYDTVDDFAGIVRDAIKDLTLLPAQFTVGLAAAALSGPGACLQYIAQFIETIKTLATSQQSSQSLFSSTDITLATFSAGAILNTVGTILTTVGMILVVVSRIAAIIVAVIGVLVSVASKIVSAVFGEYDSTRFTVSSDLNAVHVYSFVINQGTTYDNGIAKLLRDHKCVSGILYSVSNPAVVFVYLVNPNSNSDDNIGFEIHLSSDYNVSSCFKQIEKTSWATAWQHPVVYYDPDDFNASMSFGIFQRVGWSVQGTREACLFRDTSAYQHSYMPSPQKLMQRGYEPIDTGLFANIAATLSDEADAVMKQHFLSALFLYAYALLYNVIKDGPSTGYSTDDNRFVVSIYKPTTDDNPGFNRIRQLMCMLTTALFMPGADAVISNEYLDEYLTKVQSWFNGLQMQSSINSALSESVASIIAYTEWSLLDMTNGNYTSLQTNFIGQTDATRMCNFWHPFDYYGNQADLDKDTFRWNTSFAVKLPTLLWSGFIAGLIIDGLVIAAAATLAIAGTILKFKIANKRAQLQAKAEKKWYTYEDDGQTDQQWKDYKSARFKYNVVAWCTGGTTMSLGLYDDDSSTGLMGTIRGLFSKNSDVSSENVTLYDIKKLLNGAG